MGLRELLEFQLPLAFSKRRPDVAAAIQGQMGGRAELGNDGNCTGFFFLLGRIFCIDIASLTTLIQASGFVPAWFRGGTALEVSIAGGKQGLDCVSTIFVRMCSVKSGPGCNFYFFLGPPCNFAHRLNETPGSFGTIPVQKKIPRLMDIESNKPRKHVGLVLGCPTIHER
jgi:hypothetical protein